MTFSSLLPEIERECERLSRTAASGALVADSSINKGGHLRSGLSAGAARAAGRANIREAVEYLGRSSGAPDVRLNELVVSLNHRLTQGISTSPGAFRDFDSTVYPYLPARLIPSFYREFIEYMTGELEGEAPSTVASASAVARIHWDINIRGHFFADGCGRTATILGAWAFWLRQGIIPRLPERGEYLDLATGCNRKNFIDALAASIIAYTKS